MNSAKIQLQFYGTFSAWNSISNICKQFGRILTNRFFGVALLDCSLFDKSWSSYVGYNMARQPTEGCGIDDPYLMQFQGCNPKAPIGFFYGSPDEAWPKLKGHKYKIGGFVCETDQISQDWVDVCNRLDIIIVPSQFCAQAFLYSGVKSSIKIIPHGIEEEFYPYYEKTELDPFVFFNTFSLYSFPERKGCEELIRCFLKAFQGDKSVVLHLRTHNFGPIIEYRKKYNFGDQIKILPYHFGKLSNVAQLFSLAHCTVHPSKGEGFGLVPLQSIACETPVIAPPITGMADYLDNKNALLLNVGKKIKGPSWKDQPGYYYSVDEDHLIYLMQNVKNNWALEYKKVQEVGSIIRHKYSWTSVLEPVVENISYKYKEAVSDATG